MTRQELNRDIKRLAKMNPYGANYNICPVFKKEFTRLYYADREMKHMTAQSIRIMLSLNLKHRIFALHTFGLQIEL